jgi:enoyl-CoA hydratase/carnithine racemase
MAAILLEERTDGVLRLTLNRPEARNALSIELMTGLVEALGRAADDRHSRVVVIAGAGPAFCAGPICASCARIRGARPINASSRCAAS